MALGNLIILVLQGGERSICSVKGPNIIIYYVKVIEEFHEITASHSSFHNNITILRNFIHTLTSRHEDTPENAKLTVIRTDLLPVQLLVHRSSRSTRELSLTK